MRTELISKGFIGTITTMKYCIECNAPKSNKGVYCKVCSYKHRTRPSGLTYNIRVENKGWIKKGQPLRPKGYHLSEEHKKHLSKISKGQRRSPGTEFTSSRTAEDKNNKWKGDDVGYFGLHSWINRHKARVNVCEDCGKEGKTHFANISQKYLRDITDFKELCSSCHKLFDNNIRRTK